MKLVQYTSEKQVTIANSTHKDGVDIKIGDKVLFSLVPQGYGETVKLILPHDSTLDITREEFKQIEPKPVSI